MAEAVRYSKHSSKKKKKTHIVFDKFSGVDDLEQIPKEENICNITHAVTKSNDVKEVYDTKTHETEAVDPRQSQSVLAETTTTTATLEQKFILDNSYGVTETITESNDKVKEIDEKIIHENEESHQSQSFFNEAAATVALEQRFSLGLQLEEVQINSPIESSGLIASPSAPSYIEEVNDLGIALPRLYPALEQFEVEEEILQPFTHEQLLTLYYNPQLEKIDEFVDKVFKESNQFHHDFYKLLVVYQHARRKKFNIEKDIEVMEKDIDVVQDLVWETQSHSTTITGCCQDGAKVSSNVLYDTVSFNEEVCDRFIEMKKNFRNCIHKDGFSLTYQIEICRLRIENYISNFYEENSLLSEVPPNYPVQTLDLESRNYEISRQTDNLKTLISILFSFQRKQIDDVEFVRDTRKWLTEMVGRLLRFATYEDHLFILFHVLHSPPGISKWAACFVHPAPFLHEELSDFCEFSRNSGFSEHNWENKRFNHNVTMLALILKPLKYREAMLSNDGGDLPSDLEVVNKDELKSSEEDDWMVVDSDGEDQDSELKTIHVSLHEKDIFSLINQIKLEQIIKDLFIPRGDVANLEFSSESNFLKILALSCRVVELLASAMKTYHQLKYTRLNKKLGQLIRHVVEATCNSWLVFQSGEFEISHQMAQRIQLECDMILLKSIVKILEAPSLGAWQYMSLFPFGTLSSTSFWNLLRLLHLLCWQALTLNYDLYISIKKCKEYLFNERMQGDFADKLSVMSSNEVTFLLTTLANAAQLRNADDLEAIEFVAKQLFYVCYVNVSTRESCSKLGRELLQSICLQHPVIISTLLALTDKNIGNIGAASNYLFRALPHHLFQVTSSHCKSIRSWLVHAKPNQPASHLARTAMDSLNWSYIFQRYCQQVDEFCPQTNASPTVVLFLPKYLHWEAAMTVFEAFVEYINGKAAMKNPSIDVVLASPTNSNQMKQLLVSPSSSVPPSQNDLSHFSNWAWCLCFKLKLHPFSETSGKFMFCKKANLSALSHVEASSHVDSSSHVPSPHIHQPQHSQRDQFQHQNLQHRQYLQNQGNSNFVDESRISQLIMRVKADDKSPLVSYLALCMTSLGHSAEEFLKEGLRHLLFLLENNFQLPALHSIYNILPLFYDQNWFSHELIRSAVFAKCIDLLLKYDNVEKNLYSSNPKHSMICQLTALILQHIEIYCNNKQLVANIVKFWLTTLTNFSNWSKTKDILYIIDNIIKASFPIDTTFAITVDFFKDIIKLQNCKEALDLTTSTSSASLLSSISSFFRSRINEFISDSLAAKEFLWLRFVLMRVEIFCKEVENELWSSIVAKLISNPTLSAQTAFEDCCTKVGLDTKYIFQFQQLSIYRYTSLILDTPCMHSLLPMMWNEFLILFFERKPNCGSVGLKFFSLPAETTLLKKMKKKCCECSEEYKKKIGAMPDSNTLPTKDVLLSQRLTSLYHAIVLWLDEPRLHDSRLNLRTLPPQYLDQLFATLIHKQSAEWFNFVDFDSIFGELNEAKEKWFISVIEANNDSRVEHMNKLAQSINKKSPNERLALLFGHETSSQHIPPPPVNPVQFFFKELQRTLYSDWQTLSAFVQSNLKVIYDMASTYERRVTRHEKLDDSSVFSLKNLYYNKNVETVVHVTCYSYINLTHKCKGAATLRTRHNEKQMDEIASRVLQEIEPTIKKLTKEAISPSSIKSASVAVIYIETIIFKLIKWMMELSQQRSTGMNVDETINRNVEVGSTLFHMLVNFINSIIEFCPPAKEFAYSSVEALGKTFISNNPAQSTILLLTISKNPSLISLLSQFFNPLSEPKNYLSLYGEVRKVSSKGDFEVATCLATKFDMAAWLESGEFDENKVLNLTDQIVQSLASLGQSPSDRAFNLFCIQRAHLKDLCQHLSLTLGHLLIQLTAACESSQLSPEVWYDFLNLIGFTLHEKIPHEFDFHHTFDPNPTLLFSKMQVFEILDFLIKYFNDQLEILSRSASTRKTGDASNYIWLYSRWGVYVPHLARVFHAVVILVVRKVHQYSAQSTSTDVHSIIAKDISELHNKIQSLYFPWISWEKCLKACWIHHSTILSESVSMVSNMAASWIRSIEFLQACYGDGNKNQTDVLNWFWSFYINHSQINEMPDFLVEVFNMHAVTLPWNQFIPLPSCIANMAKTTEYKKSCFEMMGNIFSMVDWKECMKMMMMRVDNMQLDVQTISYVHSCIFDILVRLSNEKAILENTQLPTLMSSKDIFDWTTMLDVESYRKSVTWLAENCDLDSLLTFDLTSNSCQVIKLLKNSSNFYPFLNPSSSSSSSLSSQSSSSPHGLYPNIENVSKNDSSEKRKIYVDFIIDILLRSSSSSSVDHEKLQIVLNNLLTEIESVMSSRKEELTFFAESCELCSSCVVILNGCNPSVGEHFLHVFVQWIESSVMSLLIPPLIYVSCRYLAGVSHLTRILEAFMTAHFSLADVSQTEHCGWGKVLSMIQFPELSQDEFVAESLTRNCFFTLYSYALYKLTICRSMEDELNLMLKLNDWNTSAKPDPENEDKLFLFWHKILMLNDRQISYGGSKPGVRSALLQFVPSLILLGEDKSGAGLFGAIGFGKKSNLSLRFRVVANSIAGFVANVLNNDENLQITNSNNIGSSQIKTTDMSPQLLQQTTTRLQGMSADRSYNNYKKQILVAVNFVKDKSLKLSDYQKVFSSLSAPLYAEVYHLGILQRQD